jgi:hypothetical protein
VMPLPFLRHEPADVGAHAWGEAWRNRR